MGLNVVLLDNDETFIRWLNPDKVSLSEHEEHGKISTLKLKYPISEDIVGDIQDFSPGHKIWISGSQISRDCLYVINESVDTNIWVNQEIELTVEEVLTELNYAPLITPADLSTIVGGDNVEKAVPADTTHLKKWFGTWFQIDEYEGYEAPEQLNVTISDTMTPMEFLRHIEKETGNIFRTRYVKKPDENIIIRYLDFKRPSSFGAEKHQIVTMNYNADNILCTVDESNVFTAISPLVRIKRKDELAKWKQTNTAIQHFKELKVKKGEEIPYSFSKDTYNSMYPIPKTIKPTKKKVLIEGTLKNGLKHYFRRLPDDAYYVWCPTQLWTDGYKGTKSNTKTNRDIQKRAVKKFTSKYAGYVCPCAEDGDYTLYHEGKLTTFNNVVEGDMFICNGKSWDVIRQRNNEKVKWVKCLAVWNAPYTKRKGDFYVTNTLVDSKIHYKDIYSRPNPDSEIKLDGVNDYIEYPIEEASEEQLDDDETDDDGLQPERMSTPKIGHVTPSVYDPYGIYNDVVKELKKVNHAKVKVKANVKDLKLKGSFKLYDTVYVKIPTIDHLVRTCITKTDKNPQLVGDTKIELENDDVFKPVNRKKPVFRLNSRTVNPYKKFTFKGRLVTTVVVEKDGEVFTRDVGVPNRRVSLAIVRPATKKTTYKQTITRQGGRKQTGGYDKYGRSPDKSVICGIGLKSNGRDKGKYGVWWKGVFKNRCPACGKRGGLYWGGFIRSNNYNPISKRRTPGNKKDGSEKEGMFTCGYCDSDYSVQGWIKESLNYRLTPVSKGAIKKYSNARIGKKEAYKLVKGKMKFSEVEDTAKKTTKTENVPGNTYLYTYITDKDGWFKIPTKLRGIEKKNYTFKLTFVGDDTYDACTGSTTVKCKSNPKWTPEIKVQGHKRHGKMIRIPRKGCKCSTCMSGRVSKSVEKQAKKIVGNNHGMTAVRLLAEWVGKHIKHTYTPNFYQSPARTLRLRRGCCCCKTDLFLQMCEAVNLHQKQGLAGGFKFQYVATKDKHWNGHIFARIDRGGGSYKYIDPTIRPRGGRSPMNNVVKGFKPTKKNKRHARISTYPCLPFGRDY